MGTKPETTFNIRTLFDSVEEQRSDLDFEDPEPSDEDFSFDELCKNWTLFLEILKSENKMPSYNALQAGKIHLKENYKIEIEFNSSSMIYEFDYLKDRLIIFLREKLKNSVFEISSVINEGEAESYIKSKSEIFGEMVLRNPILKKLKADLGLDYNSND